jgi:hypothetical protein
MALMCLVIWIYLDEIEMQCVWLVDQDKKIHDREYSTQILNFMSTSRA